VPEKNFQAIRATLADEHFTPAVLNTKSSAAAGICDWIINITCYYDAVHTLSSKSHFVETTSKKVITQQAAGATPAILTPGKVYPKFVT